MTAAPRSPLSSDWRDLASLGEQIVSAPSLAAQRDRIIAMTSRLVEGDVDVWLRENLFRLPGRRKIPFPETAFDARDAACHKIRPVHHRKQKRDRKNGASSLPNLGRVPACGAGYGAGSLAGHAAQWPRVQAGGTAPARRTGRCGYREPGCLSSCGSGKVQAQSTKPGE